MTTGHLLGLKDDTFNPIVVDISGSISVKSVQINVITETVKISEVKYYNNIHTWFQYEMTDKEVKDKPQDVKGIRFIFSNAESISACFHKNSISFVRLQVKNTVDKLEGYTEIARLSISQEPKYSKSFARDPANAALDIYAILKKKILKRY